MFAATKGFRHSTATNPAALTVTYDAAIALSVGIPLVFPGNVAADWGDGATETLTGSGWKTHTYAAPGTYQATFSGAITKIWNSVTATTEYDALVSVDSWGDSALTHVWFRHAGNLTSVPNWLPATVTSLNEAFKACSLFNSSNVSNWNVYGVSNFTETFRDCTVFNQPLNWNMVSATNCQRMLGSCPAFNQAISWATASCLDFSYFLQNATSFNSALDIDTSAATSISSFLQGCVIFNQPLPLDTGNVVNFSNAFNGADAFNQALPWDVSSGQNFTGIFESANAFNGDIIAWNTISATSMGAAFNGAVAFNRDIGGWNTENVTGMNSMFMNATAFNQDLTGWCVTNLAVEPSQFAGGSSGLTAPNKPVWGTCPTPDVTAPTITSSATASVAENATLAHSLTADEAVTWSLVSGADQSQFELSGATLRWVSNGTKDYETPTDADVNNAYVVTVRATDGASNTTDQTITITVTDVAEGASGFITLEDGTGVRLMETGDRILMEA